MFNHTLDHKQIRRISASKSGINPRFDLSHGGHLTHGSPVNFSGKLYNANFYGVEEETGTIDYNKVRDQA